MSLAERIRDLAQRTLAALEASHDYHTYTKRVWKMVRSDVDQGRTFSFRNPTTKSSVNQGALAGLAQLYVRQYLTSSTFQHFVTLFEAFFFDLLRLWLAAYPRRLAKKQIDLGTILDAPDRETVVLAIVDKELNELKYERVAAWFTYLDHVVKLGCPTTDEIERIAEIKASRDILIHNQSLVNAVYVAKSGSKARYQVGELLEVPEPYHRESWATVQKVVQDVSEAALNKA